MKTTIQKFELFDLATDIQRETLLSNCMYKQLTMSSETTEIQIVSNTK